MEQRITIDGDLCFREIPVMSNNFECDYIKRELVMTKEVFIECYNTWIGGNADDMR